MHLITLQVADCSPLKTVRWSVLSDLSIDTAKSELHEQVEPEITQHADIRNKRTRDIDMLRNLFSPRTSALSLEDALELANKYMANARNECDPAKALELTNNAKSLMKDAEHIFTSKKVRDPSLSE
ncbi:hypothetical protein BGZ80_009546, partial [Entomortierella chlamydospora]